jgi:phospholipase/carboxylesterase
MNDTSLRLAGPERLPDGAVARVLLHGYGADGNGLIVLADELSGALPGTAFLSPSVPKPCETVGYGRQWFGLAERSPAEFDRGADSVRPGRLASEIQSRTPVLLVHGVADEVVPVAALGIAERALRDCDVMVQAVRRPGLGHGIDPAGLDEARAFLVRVFGLDET